MKFEMTIPEALRAFSSVGKGMPTKSAMNYRKSIDRAIVRTRGKKYNIAATDGYMMVLWAGESSGHIGDCEFILSHSAVTQLVVELKTIKGRYQSAANEMCVSFDPGDGTYTHIMGKMNIDSGDSESDFPEYSGKMKKPDSEPSGSFGVSTKLLNKVIQAFNCASGKSSTCIRMEAGSPRDAIYVTSPMDAPCLSAVVMPTVVCVDDLLHGAIKGVIRPRDAK